MVLAGSTACLGGSVLELFSTHAGAVGWLTVAGPRTAPIVESVSQPLAEFSGSGELSRAVRFTGASPEPAAVRRIALGLRQTRQEKRNDGAT